MTDSAIKEMREEIINLSNRGSQVLDDLREIVILLEAKGYTKSKTIEFLKMKNINKGRLDYSF